MSKQACVTLHRPPPLTRTLDNSFEDFSRRITRRSGWILAALTAQKKPAAPPPITMSVCREMGYILRGWKLKEEFEILIIRKQIWIRLLRFLNRCIIRKNISLPFPDTDVMLKMHGRFSVGCPNRPAISFCVYFFFPQVDHGFNG